MHPETVAVCESSIAFLPQLCNAVEEAVLFTTRRTGIPSDPGHPADQGKWQTTFSFGNGIREYHKKNFLYPPRLDVPRERLVECNITESIVQLAIRNINYHRTANGYVQAESRENGISLSSV